MITRHDVIQIELCKYVGYKYPKELFNSDMSGVRLTRKQAIKAKLMKKKLCPALKSMLMDSFV